VDRAAFEVGINDVEVIKIRRQTDLEQVNGLIIPGGESTTISKLMVEFDLYDKIIERANNEGLAILGTCAGCIVLASNGDSEVKRTKTKLLELMSMEVNRNAFGSQRESFESEIEIDLPGFQEHFHAIFIRAPVIERVWDDCKVLSKLDDKIIFAQQGNLLAAAFHPELTNDTRIHSYFLDLI
jgi:5'-phosphate synthase pdxT subunit